MSPLAFVVAVPVWIYRWTLSPLMPMSCRYAPTCSEFALEALSRHGALRGSLLTVRRLSRCHPWGGSGYDPVPPVRTHKGRNKRVERVKEVG